MSASTTFLDQPIGSPAADCKRAPAKKNPAAWDTTCVRKILCKSDKKVVDQLAKTKVKTADAIYWEDPYFEGSKWTTRKFPGGGSADSANKEITILSGTSCEDAAQTFYHEIWHQNQPAGMGWPEPSEDDAYYSTELWMINRGLPGNPSLRTKDPVTKKTIPDKKAIRALVQKEYPSPPPAVGGVPQPVPIQSDSKNNLTLVEDPVTGKKQWRKSQKGDTFAGPQTIVNEKVIPGSAWKCP